MKKLVALALSLVMLISAASTALAYSPEDPITIPFWHTRGSGANYEVLKASVDAFNETVGKEKGIIVEEIYQGNYNTNVTKIQLGSQSGDIPVIAVTSSAHTAMLLDDNLTADMAPYMAETGFDLNNLLNVFLNVPAIHDGEVHTLPYVRSTPVFYYNKTMADRSQDHCRYGNLLQGAAHRQRSYRRSGHLGLPDAGGYLLHPGRPALVYRFSPGR